MKKILLIDDDAVVLQLYRDALTRQGFQVDTAADGLVGMTALRNTPPDLLVLDLLMPKFTGVEVLKFMRGQPALKDIPVILLSNSFMNELAAQAASLGVQRALLKVRCSPSSLNSLINEILEGKAGTVDPSQLLALPKTEPVPPPKPVAVVESRPAEPKKPEPADFATQARQDLITNAARIRSDLHGLSQGLARSHSEAESDMRVSNFYRRVHFVSTAAGLANAHDMALLASAFEALLYELMGRPTLITPSVLRTIAFTTDFLSLLLERVQHAPIKPIATPLTLVVDDDPLSNRLVSSALRRAQLTARCTQDPLVAMQWLRETRFDLVLLDIEMPGMNGLELCKQLRGLPGYQRTPVIFVTSHGDFENRAKSVVSGGTDLISKPVLPIELAVKAVTHLLKANLDADAAGVR